MKSGAYIQLRSLTEPIDTTTPARSGVLPAEALFAELQRSLIRDNREKVQAEAPAKEQPQPRRPLSAKVRDLWADMPEDVRAAYPDPQHINHHVYGLPKR